MQMTTATRCIPKLDRLLSTSGPIYFDFAKPLNVAYELSNFTRHTLRNIAVADVFLFYLRIQCPEIGYIADHSLPNEDRCKISVMAILQGIHKAMHALADPDSYQPDDPAVMRQFFVRLRSIEDPEVRWQELREVRVRKVDLLEGVHVFAGLVADQFIQVKHKWNVVLREAMF
jgi:hypothetical protein